MAKNANGDEQPLDEQILWRLEDGIAWITLNRPDAQNALTPDQRDRLIELLGQASADVSTRVVVLTATGKGFAPGRIFVLPGPVPRGRRVPPKGSRATSAACSATAHND